MRQRQQSSRRPRRHPALAAVALVALIPTVGGSPDEADHPEGEDACVPEIDENGFEIEGSCPVPEDAPAEDVDDMAGEDVVAADADEVAGVDGEPGADDVELDDDADDAEVGEVADDADDAEVGDDADDADDAEVGEVGDDADDADDAEVGDDADDAAPVGEEAADDEWIESVPVSPPLDLPQGGVAPDGVTQDVPSTTTDADEDVSDEDVSDEDPDEVPTPESSDDAPFDDADGADDDTPFDMPIGAPADVVKIEDEPAVRLDPEPLVEAPPLVEGGFEEAGEGDGLDDADHAGLRAERYDGVYAQGVPIWVAMTATRFLESRDDYAADARGSTASGAYQVIDSTWNGYGGYARAKDAPPSVQDQFAYESMVAILKRYGNDVSAIPVAWYFPAALRHPHLMDIVPVPSAGNVLTPRQYQARWMMLFHQHLEAGSPVFLPADSDPLIPAIAFPVLGPTSFWDDWHAERDGGARKHEGLDFMGEIGQPLRAAFDGVVTRVRPYDIGRPGVGITITRADGLRANYFHLDGALRWHPDLDVGDTVKAGQIIAYMGATGNAGIPHLHFELRTEEGEPIAPYPAVLEAVQREQCSVGIGPWSTAFESPARIAERLEAEIALTLDEQADTDDEFVEPEVHEIEGPDGARWTVSAGGAVTAVGWGALVAPTQGACVSVPVEEFGTGAAGLSLDLLPDDWWGDEVEPEDLDAMIAAVQAERSLEFGVLVTDRAASLLRLRIGDRGILAGVTRLDADEAADLFAQIR